MVRKLAVAVGLLVVLSIGSLGFTGYVMWATERPQPSVRSERIEGAAAIAHLQQLFATNPAAFAAYQRAELSLAGRGFRKVGKPVVIRQYRLQAARDRGRMEQIVEYFVPALAAQNEYAEATSDGEIFMDPWDDGDAQTWEGSFYVTRYSDAAWALYDWQNDTQNVNNSYYMYYANRDGGERDRFEREARVTPNFFQKLRNLIEAPVEAQSGAWRRAKRWGDCFGGACLGASTACALTGPGWGHCTAAWCVGAAVTCGIYAILPT